MPDLDDAELWERHAQWWQDGFTAGADAEYEEQILPLVGDCLAGSDRVLDVGAGEGQVARLVSELGASLVVGVDPTWAQLTVAQERRGGPVWTRGRAEALPYADASFDAVIACLVFEHIPDHVPAIAEVARVLRLGGRFLLLMNHPLLQVPNSGWVVDHVLEEEYWRIGPYLVPDVTNEELSPGVVLPFVHRPLSHYVNAMAEHGLLVARMDEPPPPEGFLARAKEYRDAATIPRLMSMVAVRTS